jgi:hypothetical protein
MLTSATPEENAAVEEAQRLPNLACFLAAGRDEMRWMADPVGVIARAAKRSMSPQRWIASPECLSKGLRPS